MKRSFVAVLLWLATVGLFWQARDYDFSGVDDSIHTYNNKNLNPPSLSGLIELWKTPYEGLYVPLTYTVWGAEIALSRQFGNTVSVTYPDPRFFHFGNLLLHATNVVLVYGILLTLFGSELGAVIGALAFGWHPLQVEPVVWVSGLKDVLSGFFALMTVWLYLSFLRCDKTSRTKKAAWYASAFVCFLLGLLSKPSLAALPVALVAIEVGLYRRPLRSSLARFLPWLLPVTAIGWVTRHQQPVLSILLIPWAGRLKVAADALGFYFFKVAFPATLIPDYGRTPYLVVQRGGFAFVGVTLLGIALAAFSRNRRFWLSVLLVFVAGVLPVLGLIPFLFQNFSTVADRYVYFSLFAVAIALAYASSRWKTRWLTAAFAVLLIVWGVKTFYQIVPWQDSLHLVHYTLEHNPESTTYNHLMGKTLVEGGRFEEGIAHLRTSVRQNGSWPQFRYSLALALKRQGKFKEAKAQLVELIRLDPGHSPFHFELGKLELISGNPTGAIEPFEQVIALEPYAPAYNLLAVAYFESGKRERALLEFAEGTRLFPDAAAFFLNWADALEKMGRSQDAIVVYHKLLDLRPDIDARERLAALLGRLDRWNEAADQYRKLISFSGKTADRFVKLGNAQALSGRREEAMGNYQAALKLDANHPAARQALEDLRSGKPVLARAGAVPGWVAVPGQVKLSE